MKFEIKNRFNGEVIFSIETTTLKMAVEAAIKSHTNLSSANLSSANLSYANLSSADLSSANLSYANLSSANLSSADLSSANLSYANLSYANLSYANLSFAYLRYANLRSAYLRSADLRSADLSYAKGINKYLSTQLLFLHDQVGKIRAYKLVDKNGEGPYQGGIKYEIGKTYKVDNADTNEFIQCAAGINLATLDWCMNEWEKGYRILIAEFTAKDIAVIPTATDGKFRVHKCKIVGEKDLETLCLIQASASPTASPIERQAYRDDAR